MALRNLWQAVSSPRTTVGVRFSSSGWKWGQQELQTADPTLFSLIKREEQRQIKGLELIPSENYTSRAVLEAMGSCLTNKYSEGYPGARYYGGNQIIDEIETLCQQRALKAFDLSPEEWGVNVQPLSGSPANLAVFAGLLEPHDRLMGLDLSHGGHLTHGYRTLKKKISNTSVFWETLPYELDLATGIIDYDGLETLAKKFHPKLIIGGATCYTRDIQYDRFREICDKVGAYLHVDMAHTAGLIAAGVLRSPFEYADVVTSTTHKTLRGPRAGLMFYRRKCLKDGEDLKNRLDFSVFPRLQGGPHQHCIAGVAAALLDADTEDFRDYQNQVVKNSRALGKTLTDGGLQLVSGGTDNHTVWLDLREKGIDGARVEGVLERAGITCNKNTVPGDLKPFVPSGLRVGTPALTTRGMKENDMETVGEFLLEGISIAQRVKAEGTTKKVSEFLQRLDSHPDPQIGELHSKVENFAQEFSYPSRPLS